MYKVNLPAIPVIRERYPAARDSFMIADVADMPTLIREHCHSAYREEALNILAGKNERLTKNMEKYMHAFEQDVFVGKAWETRDSVVGGFPNVPALLAGVPCSMRQRYKTQKDTSPLTVYVELTGSSGVSDGPFVQRGAAILALVRLLANSRPVEIYTTTTFGTTNLMQMVACKLETSPLDVTRGAAMLCDETLRSVNHDLNVKILGNYSNLPRNPGASLGWAYGVPDLERRYAGQILANILNPGSTMVYIPAAHMADTLSDPAAWIREMLRRYGPGSEEE